MIFAYTGEIEVSESNADSLMLDADFLGLKDIADECAKFLESCITVENALAINHSAEMLNYEKLQEKSSNFILRHFLSFEKTEQFLHISLDYLKEIISSDGLQVASEEHVYTAMMRWLKHDLERRQEHLPQLLRCIRLPYLTADYLINDVLKNELIAASEECKSLLNGVIYSRIILNEQTLMQLNVKARVDYRELMQSGKSKNRIVIHSRSNLSLMEMYNPVTGTIISANLTIDSIFIIIFHTDTWESFTSNKKGSMFLSSAVLRDKLYTVGGEVSVPSSIDVYEPHTNSWKEICKMKIPRKYATPYFYFV